MKRTIPIPANAAAAPVAEAANPATPPARLRQIAQAQPARVEPTPVLEAVAANPNTPPDVLLPLVTRCTDAFLRNPVTPLLLLEDPHFLHPLPADALKRLLMRPAAPPLLVAPLTRHRDPDVAQAADLHVSVAGEAGPGWEAEAAGLIRGLRIGFAAEQLAELAELGLAPFWLVERLAGHPDGQIRRVVLRDDGSAERAELLDLLRRASGSRDLGALGEPDPTLEPPLLARLAAGGEWARQLAARHPNTPSDVLARLAEDDIKFVRVRVARNPATAPATLERIAAAGDEAQRIAVARNEAAPGLLLARLAAREPRVRAAVARNLNAPAETLIRLSADPDVPVRIGAARNPNTPAEALAALARDTEPLVRLNVTGNAAAPPALLETLARDADEKVRRALARRSDLAEAPRDLPGMEPPPSPPGGRVKPSPAPLPVAAAPPVPAPLPAPGPDPEAPPCLPIQHAFRRLLRALRGTGEAAPAAGVLTETERRVYNSDGEVRAAAARDPGIPWSMLKVLMTDSYQGTHVALAANRNTPPAALYLLAKKPHSRQHNIPLTIARNPNAPSDLLETLAQSRDSAVLRAVARHPNTQPRTLERLASEMDPGTRRAVRHHPNTTPYVETRLRASALLHCVRLQYPLCRVLGISGGGAPELPPFAESPEWLERFAVVVNPDAPPALIARLAEDGNRLVRAAAAARLADASFRFRV